MATSITNTSISTDTINVDNGVLYVDNNNNRVGVGTASPTAALNVESSSYPYVRVTNTGYTGLDIGQADASEGGAALIKLRDAADMDFYTADLNRMRISSTGNVGIGTVTTDPTAKLEISDGGIHVTSPTGIQGLIIDTDQSNTTVSGRFVLKNNTSASSVYYSDSLGWTFHTGTILGTTSGTQRMYLTPQGYLRLPYQPAFQAWATSGGNQHFAGGTNPSFGAIGTNVGNHFDGTTFTAPVAGKYIFSYSILSGTSGNYGLISLNVNGSPAVGSQNWTQHYTNTTNDQQNSATQILNLAANDQVNLYIHPNYNSFYWQGQYSKFFGYLLG